MFKEQIEYHDPKTLEEAMRKANFYYDQNKNKRESLPAWKNKNSKGKQNKFHKNKGNNHRGYQGNNYKIFRPQDFAVPSTFPNKKPTKKNS